MKAVIEIQARFIKAGDFIFDNKDRVFDKVKYVSKYDAKHENGIPNTILVDYGEKVDCDNFMLDDTVSIFIDYDKCEFRNRTEEQ